MDDTSIRLKSLKLFAILIVTVLFTSIGYFAGIRRTEITPIQTDGQTVTTNTPAPTLLPEEPWQHYQNHDLGFAIDYPGNWRRPTVGSQQTNTTVNFDHGFYVTFGDFYDSQARKLLSYNEVLNNYSVYHTVSDISLAGKIGKKLISQSTADEGGVEYILPEIYVIGYNLLESNNPSSMSDQSLEKTFDKMLKSLYFADENGDVNPINKLNNWHIFTHSDYSFEYPGNWLERQGTGCPSFAPVSQAYTFNVCLYTQGYPYQGNSFLETKLNMLPAGFTEISRDMITIDGHEGIKQLVKAKVNTNEYYDMFVYLQGDIDSSAKRIFQITIEGVPLNKKSTAFTLIEQIIETFKLKLYGLKAVESLNL